MKDKTLIFLHIPKAAGYTLHAIIEGLYDPNEIHTINGTHVQESVEEFKCLPESVKEKISVLKGHMYFGLHEYIPRPCSYITIMRDPIERIISNYHYILRSPAHRLYERVVSQNMSLKDYVGSKINTQLNNGQTRAMSGMNDIAFGECTAEMLESAKKNIKEYFSIVGLTERFDETLILLRRTLGWKTPYYTKANVTKNRPAKENISKDTLKVIKEFNNFDMDLYKFVKERFEELISRQPSFKIELKTFRLLNGLYMSPLYKFVCNTAQKLKN